MELVLAIGSFVGAMMLFSVVGAWLESRKRGGGLLGLKTGSGGSEERLQSLLSTLTASQARVSRYARTDEDAGLRLSVDGLSSSVNLRRFERDEPRPTGIHGQSTGDPEFDRAVDVIGERADALALLPAQTRLAIRDLLLGSVRLAEFRLDGGTLSVEIPTAGFARERPGLDHAARAIAGVAVLLRSPRDPIGVLTDNLAHDPAPGVRLESLLGLLQAHRADPRTRAALPGAMGDADQLVRLEAALAAGTQGHDTLVALATGRSTSDATAARAIEGLGPRLPLDRAAPLAIDAATRHQVRAASTRAFISALARVQSDAADALLIQLGRGAHDQFGPAVVDAIVANARPGAERLLLAVLESSLHSPLHDRIRTREAAARALGPIGTADAVLPLQEAGERFGGAVASAARKSVAAIQARIAASPGRLTLTDTEAGRLSKADDETGRVSLPDEPKR